MAFVECASMLSAMHKVQMVLTVPRTISTAFERSMMQRKDHKIFHEPWLISWKQRNRNAGTLVEQPPQEILDAKNYEGIKALIYRYAKDCPVFLKDMVFCLAEDFLRDEALLADPNIVVTLLIRDPARTMESFFNKGLNWYDEAIMLEKTRLFYRYDLLMQIAEKYHALRGTWLIIVEAEELCAQPEETFKSFCAQAGIPFIPEALHWEQGVPDEWKHSAEWHRDAADSHGFFVPNRDAQEKRFDSISPAYVSLLEEVYQSQMPYYERLKELKGVAKNPGMAKEKEQYRLYDESTPEHVKNFYRINHAFQTVDFVLQKKSEYLPLRKKKMSIWEAIDFFDTLVDESDPDLDLPQRYHLFQTAEALRNSGYPRWMS